MLRKQFLQLFQQCLIGFRSGEYVSKYKNYGKNLSALAIGVPTVEDRIAQMVVKLELEPKIEPYFLKQDLRYVIANMLKTFIIKLCFYSRSLHKTP